MPKSNSLKLVPYGVKHVWTEDNGKREPIRVPAMLEYTFGSPEYPFPGVEYRPNEPFEATLTLVELERGRSAARFWWTDGETYYPMFGQGLVEMLNGVVLDHGVVPGKWIAVKRGANYGIERYEENN